MNTHTIHAMQRIVKGLDLIEKTLKTLRSDMTTLRRSIRRQEQIKAKKR